jgi:acetyl-CoA C-acetyltransferase
MQASADAPVLIGVGQKTWHDTDIGRTPVDALCAAGTAAIEDAGADRLNEEIDALATIRFIADATPRIKGLFPRNPGNRLAGRLDIANAAVFQGVIGGNSPQFLVNHFANKLARGEHEVVMLAGAELLSTFFAALKGGEDIAAWSGGEGAEPPTIGRDREGNNATELAHGLYRPINTYPLFENSLQHHLGAAREQHHALIAELCSRMSRVAADNPYAWRQRHRSAGDIGTVARNNRYIGYPYTRAMNAVMEVDMAAAVIMTTAGKARELGIEEDRWIYLRGGADVNDIWYVSERPSLHDSPAIEAAWAAVSLQSGVTLDEISWFDLYSCFPSAVQVACRALGLSPLDERGVTVTGGLPFFGGPGNNYSLHAIATMVDRLRETGSGHGLVTANGYFLTKHSLGLYSREAPRHPWQQIDSAPLQQKIDGDPRLPVAADASGAATIETYTVAFDRDGPRRGIVVARNREGERVVANTADDAATLALLIAQDPVGAGGNITVQDGVNILEL